MAAIGDTELQMLADMIVRCIREDFFLHHLSQNLINTIKVQKMGDSIQIEIPAKVYDIGMYKDKGIIKYTEQGSYASKLDLEGSKRGYHRDFVNNAINKAVVQWTAIINGAKLMNIERF